MTLSLGVLGNPDRTETQTRPFTIQLAEGVFSICTPRHDDWLLTTNYDLRKARAVIETVGTAWVLKFPDEEARSEFEEWLRITNAEAERGIETLYP